MTWETETLGRIRAADRAARSLVRSCPVDHPQVRRSATGDERLAARILIRTRHAERLAGRS